MDGNQHQQHAHQHHPQYQHRPQYQHQHHQPDYANQPRDLHRLSVSPLSKFQRTGYRVSSQPFSSSQTIYTSMTPTTSPSGSSIENSIAQQQASTPNAAADAAAATALASSESRHARAYRSRKDRPCDNCRKRKSRCVIEETGQNCQSCRLSGRVCTFEISPTPRSRPVKMENETAESARKRSHSVMSQNQQASLASPFSEMPFEGVKDVDEEKEGPTTRSATSVRSTGASVDRLHALISTIMYGQDEEPDGQAKTPSEEEPDAGRRVPEEERGMMPVVLGSSSSEDPQLLRQASSPSVPQRRGSVQSSSELASDSPKSSMPPPPMRESQALNRTEPLQVRQVTRDPLRPVFFAFVPSHPYGRSKGKGKEVGAQGLAKLKNALSDKIGPLMAFYSLRDAAAFPLLMESQRKRYRQAAVQACKEAQLSPDIPLPPVLAAATIATATVYDVSLRPISKQAWGANLHALTEQFDHSTLVTLQVALTDLTGRPSINTSGNLMSFSQTLAISHMLGLHLDPTNWILPREEKDVRIRLWWAIVIHDKWSSLCWGRPSIIHEQDYSTPLPRRNSLSPCQEHLQDRDLKLYPFEATWQMDNEAELHTPGDTFAGLCRLTLILSDILSEFHSIRSSQMVHRDAFGVAQQVKSYLVILEDWKLLLPRTLSAILRGDSRVTRGAEKVPGTRSLQLSYLGVNLLLCRTALDAVTTKGPQESSRLMPAHKTALHGTLMVVEYLESLSSDDYDGFFLHYGSHHLASCLSLLARLSFGFSRVGDEELLSRSVSLMQRLLVVLSQAHRLYKWDLAELALTRSRTILPTLEARIPHFPHFFAEVDANGEGGSGSINYDAVPLNGSTQARSNRGAPFNRRDNLSGSSSHDNPVLPASYSTGSSGSTSTTAPFGTSYSGARFADSHDVEHPLSRNTFTGTGSGAAGSNSNGMGDVSEVFGFGGATIPIDAVGLPYPFGMPSGDSLMPGSHTSSHLLSSMEVDWLGMGLQPQVYPDWVSKVGSAET